MNTKLAFASGLAALLFAAAPAASAHGLGLNIGLGAHADANDRSQVHADGLNLSLGAHAHADADADDHVRATASSTHDSWRAKMEESFSHMTLGIVTSITGSTFTIDPVGAKSTTTVSTNSSTVFRAHGAATTSSALAVGAKVLLFGTTTATSTAGDSFSASFVKIFEHGLGHLRFWAWFR
ncbi:MAG TPA: hypothetical protein VMT80_01605 [Candidatus Paceibacterota bacterium]|nr:hypothetical protein [Candidatus Paceibacterota bacterium]